MIEKVKEYIVRHGLICPGDEVIAAVSGGADSVAMCLILSELAEEMDFSLSAVHVEHGIRGEESLEDERFVLDFCEGLSVPCTAVEVRVPEYAKKHGIGTEEAARILRYGAFSEIAKILGEATGSQVRVALAHHMDDNAETVLFNLVRGSGIDGLCGMRPLSAAGGGADAAGLTLIRPLLCVPRKEIEAFLGERGQDFRQDATNADTAYSRNRIRHDVLPALSEINAQAAEHIDRAAEELAQARDYLDTETEAAISRAVRRGKGGDILIDIDAILACHEFMRGRVVHRALGEISGGKKDISSSHVEEVLSLMGGQTGRHIDLPRGVRAVREYGNIRLTKVCDDKPKELPAEACVSAETLSHCRETGQPFSFPVGNDGAKIVLRVFPFSGNIAEISSKMYTKWFDYDIMKKGFCVRGAKKDDYFILDEAEHKKTATDEMKDAKVPAGERDRQLVVAQGSLALWRIGGRMGHAGRVCADAKDVLEISYEITGDGGTDDGASGA
ncbi:MAG: tRNA lysidine(34) synthetase TilS [Clostridiales bacterium]|nr:tRNA lysidine(34) synthetase TilS [Clostridiales bacterium]